MADAPATEKDDEDDSPATERKADLGKKAKVKEKLLDLYKDVRKGFEDQRQRALDIQDYWDIYNNKLGSNQFYSGNSRIFVPIVYNAVNARKTRFVNQLFPQSARCVEAITEDGTVPHKIIALAEHYARKARLREMAPAWLRNGDVEGQINLYVSWNSRKRHVVRKVKKPVQLEDGMTSPDAPVEDIEEMVLKSDYPTVEILSDADVLILPFTAAGPNDAIAQGGSVTVLRRWSKARIRQLIDDEEIDKKLGENLIEEMSKDNREQTPDTAKEMAEAAGVRGRGPGKIAQVYETWSTVKVGKEHRLCRTFFASEDKVLSCKRNPLWCDRLPIISEPLERVHGSAKGVSKVAAVADMQYFANDTINEAADSAAFSLLPIIMTDPLKNPRVGSMVLNLAAVWETSPNDTKFAEFPELWKQGLELVAGIQQSIFQTLSVNPSQITQGAKKKQSQAEVANEQQVDLLTTSDVVTVIEDRILSPLINLFLEMDHQYRDEAIRVVGYGELGRSAAMADIDPISLDTRFELRWFGVEQVRSVQMIQQQIAMMNVVTKVPPPAYQGYKLNLAPAIVQMMESAFGPRLAPLIFQDTRSQLSTDPQEENVLMAMGHDLPVHELDDHKAHIAAHIPFGKQTGDPKGLIQAHVVQHVQKLQAAAQAQAQSMQPGGGAPGGPPGGPGPQPGAQPGAQRPVQAPPGAIPSDQLKDPRAMPRKMG